MNLKRLIVHTPLLRLGALVALSVSAFATTTVTGHISNLNTTTPGSTAFVRFWLRGTRGNQPRITGSGAIAPQVAGSEFYVDLPADASGNISGTIYSTRNAAGTGAGDIEVGGSYTAVYYGMQIFNNGVAGPEVPIHARSGTSFDISNVTPVSTSPVVVAPTGDTTYARVDGGNQPFTSKIGAPGLNNIVLLDGNKYTTLAAAVADCPNPGTIIVSLPVTVALSTVVPSTCALVFYQGGLLTVASGKTLTINGPLSSPAVPIFAGSGTVTGLSRAYPEWFAASLTYPMAASAVLAAYNALAPNGGGSADLLLLNQAYISPWTASPTVMMTKSNIRTIGAGKPIVKPDYSGLVTGSGTIIYGQWPTDTSHGASHIEYRDFGADYSSNTAATYFSGVIGNPLTMNNNGQVVGSGVSEGDIVDHVIGLGYSVNAAFHCALFENIDNLKINDLDCFYNTHGIVIKATRYEVSHSISLGHSSDSFYVKSETYGLAGAGSIHDSQCGGSYNYSTGVATSDTGVCVFVQGASANTDANDIHDVRGFGLTAGGIVVNTLGTSTTANTTIANIELDTVVGPAIQVAGAGGSAFRTSISGVIANNSTNAVSVDSASTQTSIKGVTATNCTGHCFLLDGTMTQLYDNQSQGSTGNDYFQTGGTVAFGETNKGTFGSSGGTRIGGTEMASFGATTATAATAGNAATTTYTWPFPFADASYTANCTPNGTITGTPAWQGFTAQTATQITVSVIATTNAASSFGGVTCSAKHAY